jgi:radical SAM-linked protein
MMTVLQRTVLRAALPIRYTQGFNPHPILSLPCPRPTGVASQDDLLVFDLNRPAEPIRPADLLEQLNQAGPGGLECIGARALDERISPQPLRVEYRLCLDPTSKEALQQRLAELESQPNWTLHRRKKRKRSDRNPGTTQLDLRDLTEDIELADDGLRFALVPDGSRWAKPAEILRLLGLDEQTDLARLIRTRTTFDMKR